MPLVRGRAAPAAAHAHAWCPAPRVKYPTLAPPDTADTHLIEFQSSSLCTHPASGKHRVRQVPPHRPGQSWEVGGLRRSQMYCV